MISRSGLNTLKEKAFEYYYNLGESRSIEAVAKEFKRTVRTIRGWRRENLWDNRIIQLETEKKNSAIALAVKTDYRIILQGLIAKAVEGGEIQINTVEDLATIMQLDLLIMGESTGINGGSNVVELPESVRNLLDAKIAELKQKN